MHRIAELLRGEGGYVYSTSASAFSSDSTDWTEPARDVPELPPFAPTNVRATAGNGSATVTWTAAVEDGSSVTGYTISAVGGSPTSPTVGAGTHSVNMTGLTNGRTYTFAVVANSAAGSSVPSHPSNAVVPRVPPPPVHTTGGSSGYWMLDAQGHVYAFGGASGFAGAVPGATAMAPRPGGKGYWVTDAAGHVFTFGNAPFLGDVADSAGLAPGGRVHRDFRDA